MSASTPLLSIQKSKAQLYRGETWVCRLKCGKLHANVELAIMREFGFKQEVRF